MSQTHTHTQPQTPPVLSLHFGLSALMQPVANGAGPALPLSRLPVATPSRYNGMKGQKVVLAETRPSVESAIGSSIAPPARPTHTSLYIASMHPKTVTDYLADLKVTLNNIEKEKKLLLKLCSLKKKINKKLSLAHKKGPAASSRGYNSWSSAQRLVAPPICSPAKLFSGQRTNSKLFFLVQGMF